VEDADDADACDGSYLGSNSDGHYRHGSA